MSSYEPFKEKYFKGDQLLIDKFNEIEDRSSKGEITLEQSGIEFADLANISVEQCVDELSSNPRNEELLDFVASELKDKYKIGFLSNVAADRTNELFTKEDLSLFDDIVLSYKVNMAKPDERIFELGAKRLGTKPEECLFVDDLEKYLVGARQVGMKTILYTDFESFKHELESLL